MRLSERLAKLEAKAIPPREEPWTIVRTIVVTDGSPLPPPEETIHENGVTRRIRYVRRTP